MLDLFIKLSENPNIGGIGSETLRALKKDRSLINADFRSKKKHKSISKAS